MWLLTAVAFILFVVFFDRNSFVEQAKLKDENKELKAQRDYYLERIAQDSAEIVKLEDDGYLEKYAREHFLMKRDSDVVYVMEP